MKIQSLGYNYFSTPIYEKKESNYRPSFSKLIREDFFEKRLDKSKDFTDNEKSLAKKLVNLTKEGLNNKKYDDFETMYCLYKANKKDEDPRGHRDRILFSIEDDRGLVNAMFIDPCIRFDDDTEIDDKGLKQLAKDLVDWHDRQCDSAIADIIMGSGPPQPYESDDPLNGWIDPFPM